MSDQPYSVDDDWWNRDWMRVVAAMRRIEEGTPAPGDKEYVDAFRRGDPEPPPMTEERWEWLREHYSLKTRP